jgi:hypothetical protein
VAGYPSIASPCGFTADGRPAGMWMYAGFLQEAKLLAFAYALEQAIQPRRLPRYLGTLQPLPPDPGVCAALPPAPRPSHHGSHVCAGRAFVDR